MYKITGIIRRGSKRASALGYPTINIPLTDASVSGVYAATVEVEKKKYAAAAFADPSRGILEAHLLDFMGDLYGQTVVVELHQKLRESEIFTDDEKLKAAIAADIAKVRESLKN